jgi:hypothetical protein
MRSLVVVVLLVMLAALAAIYFYLRPPRDLALISLRVVDGEDADLIRDIGHWGADRLFAIPQFRTSTNLAQLGRNGFYSGLFVDVFRCELGDSKVGRISEGHSLVFDERGSVGLYNNSYQEAGHHTYHINISLKERSIAAFNHYDLTRSPRDICFVVVPALPYAGFWPTNTVRIDRVSLERAIERYRAGASGSSKKKA